MPGSVVPGAVRMRALAADLPNGLLTGFRLGRELPIANASDPPRIYAAGMGGSAIAIDLLRGLVEAETRITLTIVRSPDLPRGADRSARALIVSYSGETWEALRAYEAAGRAGADRVVITSGRTLAERAEADGVPVLRVPPGMPSRAAVGLMVGGVLGLLDPHFPESNESRIARIAERLRSEIGRFARSGGPSEEIAASIGDRIPYVYAATGFRALARRWETQIQENAKRLATSGELPEAFHNAMVGWAGMRRVDGARWIALILQWSEEDATVRRGTRVFEHTLSRRGVPVVRVPLASEDRLEALLEGVALGDQVSLRMAERSRIDPCPIPEIDLLRSTLGAAARPEPIANGPRSVGTPRIPLGPPATRKRTRSR
ncbi:MAG: SIS domain-containing protein [Thermoplasmata archaeon]